MSGIQLIDFFLCGLAIAGGISLILWKLIDVEKRLIDLTKAIRLEKGSNDYRDKGEDARDTSIPREVLKSTSVRAGIPIHSDYEHNRDGPKHEKG